MSQAASGWGAARSRGREAALQMLYQGEVGKLTPPIVRTIFWQVQDDEDPETRPGSSPNGSRKASPARSTGSTR